MANKYDEREAGARNKSGYPLIQRFPITGVKEIEDKIPVLNLDDYGMYETVPFKILREHVGISPVNDFGEVLESVDGDPEAKDWLARNTPPTQLWPEPHVNKYKQYAKDVKKNKENGYKETSRTHKLKEPKDTNKHQTKEYK